MTVEEIYKFFDRKPKYKGPTIYMSLETYNKYTTHYEQRPKETNNKEFNNEAHRVLHAMAYGIRKAETGQRHDGL